MTDPKATARPSQVTMAAWVAVVGSALIVLSLFDAMGQLRSVEMRDTIDEFLATPPGSGLGLDRQSVVSLLRALMLVSGAAAAAALVFAIYVLQRNRAARIGFTVSAVLIMLTAPVAGGFLPVLIGFAAVMLWSRPARDWFAGAAPSTPRPPDRSQEGHRVSSESSSSSTPGAGRPDERPSGSSSQQPSDRPSGTPEWPRVPDQGSDRPVPPPTRGFGSSQDPPRDEQPAGYPPQGYPQGQPQGYPQGQPQGYPQQGYPQQGGQPPQWAGQYAGYPGAGRPPQDPDKRPTGVTVAAWLTWVFSGLAVVGFSLIAMVMVVAPGQFLEALRREPGFESLNVSLNDVMAIMWVLVAVVLFWSVAAMVLAWFAFRRQNWARIMLAVSAGIGALFTLAAFPVGLLHMLAAIATIVLLFVGDAGRWYSPNRSAGTGGYGGGYGPGGYPGGYPQQGQQPGSGYPQQGGWQPPAGGQQDRPQQDRPQQDRPGGDEQEPPKNVW